MHASTSTAMTVPVRLGRDEAESLDPDAYGLPELPRSSGRPRMPDAFRSKKWEKPGQRKKVKKQLGQKVGYTLHHWRLKQKETHDKLIRGATSYVGGEMKKHAKIYEHNRKVSELAANNKKAAMAFAEKHRRKNMLVEKKRLAAVQPHFRFSDFEHEYREHAHKMKTQATVDDQWMPAAQRRATALYMTPTERRKHKARKRLRALKNGGGGNKGRRGHGGGRGRGAAGRRPATAGASGRRRQGSPGSRVVGLDEFLQDGMSSVMPLSSPMRVLRPTTSAGSMVLLNSSRSTQSQAPSNS